MMGKVQMQRQADVEVGRMGQEGWGQVGQDQRGLKTLRITFLEAPRYRG